MTTVTKAPPKRPKIDPEFRDLLPPLSEEEQKKLEIKLQSESCLKPLIVWREENILLDGHHSLAIYEKYKIPYTVEYMPFPSREMAIEWVIDNQLGRRNLTDERRAYYRGKKYLNHKQAHGAQERFSSSPSAHNEHLGATAENIGSDDGVSPATVRRDAAFAAGVDQLSPGAKEKVLNGQSDAPKTQIAAGLFCERCKRNGPSRDCPKCARLQAKDVEPSKISKPKKSGTVKFDFKEFDKHFGHVARGPDALGNAYGEKESQDHRRCVAALREFYDTWKSWKERLLGIKE